MVETVQQEDQQLVLDLVPGVAYEVGEQVGIYDEKGNSLGDLSAFFYYDFSAAAEVVEAVR